MKCMVHSGHFDGVSLERKTWHGYISTIGNVIMSALTSMANFQELQSVI